MLRRYNRMVDGKILVRDVASLAYDGMTYQYGPETYDAETCEDRCRRVPGCNAWAACEYKAVDWKSGVERKLHPGCGAGCLKYVKTNKIWSYGDKGLKSEECGGAGCSERMVNITWPADFVGPYNQLGVYGTCAWTCKDGKVCKPNGQPGVCEFPTCADPKAEVATDRFALGKCVLMEVKDPTKPSLIAGPAGSGWASGTISAPKDCSGVSAYICSQCAALPGGAAAAKKCRDCIRSKGVTGAKEVTLGDQARIWCKGPDGKFEDTLSESRTRLSEFGCLYKPLDRLQEWERKKGAVCEARRDIPY